MTAEADIAAIADGGDNPPSRVRTALTSVLGRADGTGAVTHAAMVGSNFAGLDQIGLADRGNALPVQIPGTMYLRAFAGRMQAASSGTWQWGLFDYSSDPTACTKLAGGSGAMNATGWQTIAADSAPVEINAGNYMLIFKSPAANQGVIYSANNSAGSGAKTIASYVWDDTPDLTTAWGGTSALISARLVGDLISGTQW